MQLTHPNLLSIDWARGEETAEFSQMCSLALKDVSGSSLRVELFDTTRELVPDLGISHKASNVLIGGMASKG